jgi:thymidylate kinase
MRTRRGIAVGVIGPDGAGKTTLVNGLRDALPFPTRILYMGLTGGRLPRADALRVPGVVLAARLAILWLRWAVGLYHRARGRVVLFDRYTFDGTVPSGRRQRMLARASRRLQARACPQPDLVLLLDASGDTMHARKGEYEPERLEEWRAAYGRLGGRLARLEVLDAEQPVDAVRRDALAAIWRCYAERWRQAAA